MAEGYDDSPCLCRETEAEMEILMQMVQGNRTGLDKEGEMNPLRTLALIALGNEFRRLVPRETVLKLCDEVLTETADLQAMRMEVDRHISTFED